MDWFLVGFVIIGYKMTFFLYIVADVSSWSRVTDQRFFNM